ncbi:MAG: hypothetical protein KA369_08230 [Spirochaetes bacterium]|nr:hypothetical protein [Spirochaetota bacterium]
MNINVELRGDKELQRGFVDFEKAAVIACKNTLNVCVALTRRNAVQNIKNKFILRNNYTVRNIQYDKASGNSIGTMQSVIGATKDAEYMRTQELGGESRSRGKYKSIPQPQARMGKSTSKPVQKDVYLSKIRKKFVRGTGGRHMPGRSRFVAMAAAGFMKKKFIKRGSNIFRVKGFSKPNRDSVRIELENLYYLKEGPVHVEPREWLEPATRKPAHDFYNIFKSQLRKLWKHDII